LQDTALFSYTLQVSPGCFNVNKPNANNAKYVRNISQAKSEGYRRSRHTRVFSVAVSGDESGEEALDWLMDSLVEDGDEVIAMRVIELDEGGESLPARFKR
jgi:hypothetical protein